MQQKFDKIHKNSQELTKMHHCSKKCTKNQWKKYCEFWLIFVSFSTVVSPLIFTMKSHDSYVKKRYFWKVCFYCLFLIHLIIIIDLNLCHKIKWSVLLVIEIENIFFFIQPWILLIFVSICGHKMCPMPIHHTLSLTIDFSNGFYTVESCAICIVKFE